MNDIKAWLTSTEHLCPWCGEVPVADYNVFPQSLWVCNTQRWHCEKCLRQIVRRFTTGSRWTPWEKR